MTKLLHREIERCGDCLYLAGIYYCLCTAIENDFMGRPVLDENTIPSWCPLPDLEPRKEQGDDKK